MFRLPSVTLGSTAIFVGTVIIGAYVIFGGPSDVKRKKKRRDNIPGLANIGNSCFLNAIVQALASCPLFVSWLKSKQKEPSPPLVSALHDLLKVLNNDSERDGDACAGEVLCALREHGWIISTEEQDAHEFLHALTATIDDELTNAVAMPSLLDLSWVETGGMTELPDSDTGVVLKSDCWRESKNQGLGKSVSGKHFVVNNESDLKIISESNTEVSVEKNVASNEHSVSNGKNDINVNIVTEPNTTEEGLTSHSSERHSVKDSNCDNEGCEMASKQIDHDSSHHTEDFGTEEEANHVESKISTSCDRGKNILTTSHCANGLSEGCTENGFIEGVLDVQVDTELEVSRKGSPSPMEEGTTEKTALNDITIIKAGLDAKQEVTLLNWKSHNSLHDSPFKGYLASQLQCTLCGYKNPAQWTSFESLSLSLPSLSLGEISLQGLMDSYITQEKVTDVTCDACTKRAGTDVRTMFTKQLTIGKLPSCLCFHIKRTVWMDNGSAVKRQDHVLFPEFLTMDPYTYMTSVNNQDFQSRLLGGKEANILSGIAVDTKENTTCSVQPLSTISSSTSSSAVESSPFFHVGHIRCEHLYRLKAVIVHVGDAFRGHFVTYRRGALGTRTRNKWFYTSDITVRETSLEEARKANAYMILYEKVAE